MVPEISKFLNCIIYTFDPNTTPFKDGCAVFNRLFSPMRLNCSIRKENQSADEAIHFYIVCKEKEGCKSDGETKTTPDTQADGLGEVEGVAILQSRYIFLMCRVNVPRAQVTARNV